MKNKSQASRGRVTPPQFLLLSTREGSSKWTLWCFQAVITYPSRHIPLWGILNRASTLASKEQVRKEVVDIYLFQETLWITASGFSSRIKGMRYFSPRFLDGYFPLQLYFNTHWRKHTLWNISFCSLHFHLGFRMVETTILSPEG